MKRKPAGRNMSVYDFDEGDTEPFSAKKAKKKKLFEGFFNARQDSRGGDKNKRNSDTDLIERSTKNISCEFVKETDVHRSSSLSDVIETDDSDVDSKARWRDLDMRFGGGFGVSTGVFQDEDPVAEESKEVVIHGEELWLSDRKYSSPEFVFTAATIQLKAQSFDAAKLPFSTLKKFSSGPHEEGLFFIELDLTEHGARFLQQHLGYSDNRASCHTITSTFSDNNSRDEKIKQITSLSDGYKSIWRPEKEYARYHSKNCVNCCIHKDRNRDESENERLGGDCILQESRASLNDWCDLIYPTEDDRDAVTVTKYDYLLLDPDQFLSDTVIDFYIKYLQSQIPEADKKRFYFYNSFFFQKLTEAYKNLQNGLEKSKLSFERLKRWTAGINIFDKDYLFIPIMQNAHWSLVIICHPGYPSAGCSDEGGFSSRLILHLDSLEGCHTCVAEPIQSYLLEAWRDHNESIFSLKFEALQVPQQTNYSDCGLFLLHYVELFIKEVLERPPTDVAFHEWFNPADVSRKRVHIQSLIQDLRARKSAESHGEHVRPRHLTDNNAERSSDVAQRRVSFGCDVCNGKETAAFLSGNMSDQAFSMHVSHHLHHENDVQLSACSRLEHDHVESGCVEVIGDGHHSHHCCQYASLDKLGTYSLLQQGAAVNHVRPILIPLCTHVEGDCAVVTHEFVSLDDSLECNISDVNLEDLHAPMRLAVNRPDECTANVVDGPVKSKHVKSSLTPAIPDRFVNSSTKCGVAFCCHDDDKRFFDRQVFWDGKFSVDETSSEQLFYTCSTSSGNPVGKAGSLLSEVNTFQSPVKDDSFGDSFSWSEGKTAVDIDFRDATHECIGIEDTKLQSVSEVVTPNRSSEVRILQEEDATLLPTLEADCTCVSRSRLVDEESCTVTEAGLDGCHHLSADRGLMSNVVTGFGDGKGEQKERPSQRQRRSDPCKVASMPRRITRSIAKTKVQDSRKGNKMGTVCKYLFR